MHSLQIVEAAFANAVVVFELDATAEGLNLPERLLHVVRRDRSELLQRAVAALQLAGEGFQLVLGPLPLGDILGGPDDTVGLSRVVSE